MADGREGVQRDCVGTRRGGGGWGGVAREEEEEEGSHVHSGSFHFKVQDILSSVPAHLPETAQTHGYFCTACIVR